MNIRSFSRRVLLAGTASIAVAAALSEGADADDFPATAEALPLERVRLTPSIWLDAVESNRAWLHRLEPDRLLHNFRQFAGLKPKGAVYGGWESDTIAGHTLGHYLSACSLMHAQTGDAECKHRVDYIVSDLALCQQARGDGYVAGLTRKRGDVIEDGRVLFDELKRGDIRVQPFDLNGCWVPLYNFHKTLAGLLDAERYCGNTQALDVATGLGSFIDGVFADLDDAQTQRVLDCEHGGINESFAALYQRTGDTRWRHLAERIYHRKVLDPLTQGRDELDGLHANTQIPKLIGLARLYEAAGDARHAAAAKYFWQRVVRHRTYTMGGNADREYFQMADGIARYITEQTCESCNSYNMLKLTRHMYRWRPDASWFDYYERTHLNHILAQHDPESGMFTYMMPLMAGAHREFSTPFDDFWCCMGTGMETHSKHGDSVYWQSRDHLFVNLFVPSELDWREKRARIALATDYPFSPDVTLRIAALQAPAHFTLALRVPSWCSQPRLRVNGKAATVAMRNGYAVIHRTWHTNDKVTLTLPLPLRTEPANDDPRTIAFLNGPVVLAADLGDAAQTFNEQPPSFVTENPLSELQPVSAEPAVFRSAGPGRDGELTLAPFFRQYHRNSAVYFKQMTPAQWVEAQAKARAQKQAEDALDAQSIDIARLGDTEDEKAHDLTAKISYAVIYRGRTGRDARSGGYFALSMKSAGGPLALRAVYSGDDRNRLFQILVDGTPIGHETLAAEKRGGFITRDYPIPAVLTAAKSSVEIRVEPDPGHSAGPVFGLRLLRQATTAI